MQEHLELIPHKVETEIVQQRVRDGYINATAMCQAARKQWNDYSRLSSTKAFVEVLSTETGIPVSELIQSVRGGDPSLQGTWVHPQVAIHLAQWLSPAFAVKVSQWVHDWMSGKSRPNLPYHLERYLANNDSVPAGYFSVLAELTILVIGPLERLGYRLPPEMVPDISEGRMFCKWLRDSKGIDTNKLPTYFHRYPDGRLVPAKLYPEELLADFRRHVRNVWIPVHAEDYFGSRDREALAFVPRLLEGSRRSLQLQRNSLLPTSGGRPALPVMVTVEDD